VHVRRREPQEPVAGVDEQVLPAVVLNEAVAMVAAVEFDHESRRGIVEVGSAYETLVKVAEIRLDFGAR
jgi:hypothetical protein